MANDNVRTKRSRWKDTKMTMRMFKEHYLSSYWSHWSSLVLSGCSCTVSATATLVLLSHSLSLSLSRTHLLLTHALYPPPPFPLHCLRLSSVIGQFSASFFFFTALAIELVGSGNTHISLLIYVEV